MSISQRPVQVSVSLPADVFAMLETLAKRTGKDSSAIVSELISARTRESADAESWARQINEVYDSLTDNDVAEEGEWLSRSVAAYAALLDDSANAWDARRAATG